MKLYENEMRFGDNETEFFETLKELSEQTKCEMINSCTINLFTIKEIDNKNVYGILHMKGDSKLSVKVPLETLKEKSGLDDRLLLELKNKAGCACPQVLIDISDKWYFVSDNAINTIAQRAGCTKTQAYIRDNFPIRYHRDGLLKANLYYFPGNAQVLFKTDEKVRKIYALFSPKYAYINQYDMVCKTLDLLQEELGKYRMNHWEINHIYTDLCVEFPEKAEEFSKLYDLPSTVVPGIHIHTSDVGESSVIVNGTIRTGKSYGHIPTCTVRKEHSSDLKVENIISDIEKKIYPEFCKIPQRLVELLKIDVENPSGVIRKIYQDLGYRRSVALGNKKGQALLEDLLVTINDRMKYTAYDIANYFLEIPSMVDDSEIGYRNMDVLREAGVAAVLYPYENI